VFYEYLRWNLPYTTDEAALKELFGAYGEVVTAKIIKDKHTNNSKGFGFIEMADNESGLAAISALEGTRLDGRVLKISQARNPKERERHSRF